MAVEELEYANGPARPPGRPAGSQWPSGAVGVILGRRQRDVRRWQLGHMPLSHYEKKHATFAEAMPAVDRSVKLIAVGAGALDETLPPPRPSNGSA